MLRIKTFATEIARETRYQTTSSQVSETLPNDTMSMAELVDRFVKGHTIPGLKNYPYDSDQPEEEILPNMASMSKTDIAQMQIDVKEDIQEQEQTLINTRKTIAAQKQKLAKAKKITALKETKTPTDPPK